MTGSESKLARIQAAVGRMNEREESFLAERRERVAEVVLSAEAGEAHSVEDAILLMDEAEG